MVNWGLVARLQRTSFRLIDRSLDARCLPECFPVLFGKYFAGIVECDGFDELSQFIYTFLLLFINNIIKFACNFVVKFWYVYKYWGVGVIWKTCNVSFVQRAFFANFTLFYLLIHVLKWDKFLMLINPHHFNNNEINTDLSLKIFPFKKLIYSSVLDSSYFGIYLKNYSDVTTNLT